MKPKSGDEDVTFGKAVRCFSVGLIIGIVCIGLLPFLVIYSYAEIFDLFESETSPILMLIGKLIGGVQMKRDDHD
jgi:hypothetical protein